MSTLYPGALDGFSTKVDAVDSVVAQHINDPQDSIVAIETELGTDPAGAYATVKARLLALEAYGACYGNHIGWSQVGAVQNTWYNIADADMISGPLNLVEHDGNGKLTVTNAGDYKIGYSLCYEDTIANNHVEVGIEVSGSGSAHAAGQTHSENKFANEEEHLSSVTILTLGAGATIEIAIRTTDAGGPTLSVQGLNITVKQVGG